MLADGVCLVGFNDELLGKGALNVREGHGAAKEAHVQTMILLTHLAEAARAAWARRRNGNSLTHCEVFDVRAKRADHARNFMPECHRLFNAHSTKTTVLVIMQIRTTNAPKRNVHTNLIGAHVGQLSCFNS